MPRYIVLTGTLCDLSALLEMARLGARELGRTLTGEEHRGLLRLERAVAGESMPGHAPGHHRGPELDTRRKIVAKPPVPEGA